VVRRTYPLAALALIGLGGCGQLEAYMWDPTNLTVLGVFAAFFVLLFFFTFFVGRPEKKARQIQTSRKERAWMEELGELRADFIKAQQAVLDRCFELMTEKQKDDPDLRNLRLKVQSAMTKVIKLQEEMMREGVTEERIGAWELL
jgi:hypothetical protein